MKKKILLVGGCGFIGHNLSLFLTKKGHHVSIIDSLSVNNLLTFNDPDIIDKDLFRLILNERIDLINSKKLDFHVIDARNYHAYSKIISDFKPDTIIHLAAVSHSSRSNKNPHDTFDHSLRTLENTLDVSRERGTHVIYLSSSMVYGNFDGASVNELSDCKPIGIYGSLKLAGEIMVKAYNQVYNLPYTIIRPSALYGERCVSRRVGQIFIENLLNNKELSINGDGNEKLDFTYIEDLMDGIEKCCINDNAKNETFNLTYGNAKSVNELINILKKNFKDVVVTYKSKEKFNPERGTLEILKAKSKINYNPNFSLEVGYQKYIDWYKEFYSRKKINVIKAK